MNDENIQFDYNELFREYIALKEQTKLKGDNPHAQGVTMNNIDINATQRILDIENILKTGLDYLSDDQLVRLFDFADKTIIKSIDEVLTKRKSK